MRSSKLSLRGPVTSQGIFGSSQVFACVLQRPVEAELNPSVWFWCILVSSPVIATQANA